MSWRDVLLKMLADPKAASEAMTVGAFIITSIMVLHAAFTHALAEYEFIGYMAVWAMHGQATSLVALQRDRMEKSDDDAR